MAWRTALVVVSILASLGLLIAPSITLFALAPMYATGWPLILAIISLLLGTACITLAWFSRLASRRVETLAIKLGWAAWAAVAVLGLLVSLEIGSAFPFVAMNAAGVLCVVACQSRRLIAVPEGVCETCGYDLTGLPNNVCPECGTRASGREEVEGNERDPPG